MKRGKPKKIAFGCFQKALKHQVTLAHYYDLTHLCVCTNASDIFCSRNLAQFSPEDPLKARVNQSHQHLAFLLCHLIGFTVKQVHPRKKFDLNQSHCKPHALTSGHSRRFWTFHGPSQRRFSFRPILCCLVYFSNILNKVLQWIIHHSEQLYMLPHPWHRHCVGWPIGLLVYSGRHVLIVPNARLTLFPQVQFFWLILD